MNVNKYKWKNRLILVNTPNYINNDYKNTKELYMKNEYQFHKRFIKLITNRQKDIKFSIHLIGFDGNIYKKYNKLKPNDIFKIVDNMPIGKMMKENNKLKPKNLSLYSDYNKETTVKNLGFKNKEKAIYTINTIKTKDIKYQINVLNTMIGRAKNHPYYNDNMKEAVKILSQYLNKIKKNL